MSYLTTLLSPLNLLFFVIVAGFTLGRIRIKGISLGIAGILFTAMFVGFLMNLLMPEGSNEVIINAQSTLKIFSKLGTSLFVSVIGLQTGFSIKNNSKNSIISFSIGAIMSISGVMVMLLISTLDKTISYSSLLGILCGALTSTPGLSSVCELVGSESEMAVLGYSCSYLLGVILVVFFVQLLAGKRTNNQNQTQPQRYIKSKIYPELILICLTALLGNILGNITIESITLSFGTTACTLMIGLVVGCIFCKSFKPSLISDHCLNAFRNLGLALFFTGTGYVTGIQVIEFNIKTVLYGVLITLSAMFSGWVLCKFAVTRFKINTGFIIAGGMTSSPAYGAIASNATETTTNCFSFSYFGALISLIAALQFIKL